MKIRKIRFSRHRKVGKPDSLRVDYHENIYTRYSEWVCLEHHGFAGRKARQWWLRHGGDLSVSSVSQALQQAESLKIPTQIKVEEDGKYWRILDFRFDNRELPSVEVEEDQVVEEYAPIEEEEAPF